MTDAVSVHVPARPSSESPSTSGSNGQSSTDALDEIRAGVLYDALVTKMIRSAVLRARVEHKHTWNEIAGALGVTHQAARARFGPIVKALENGHLNGAESANGFQLGSNHVGRVDGDPAPSPRHDGD
jgi:hypothetical protein